MKELPKRVTIRGFEWQIKRVPGEHPALAKDTWSEGRAYCGLCDKYGEYGPMLNIYVREDLTEQVAWGTVWHEVLHAIAWGFKPFDMKKEMPIEVVAGEILNVCRQWKLL